LRDDTPQARAEFLARIESRRAEEDEPSLRPIRRGWCLGSPAFQQQMLDLIQAQQKEAPGQLRVENSILRAQRIIPEELARLGWTAEQLFARRRNDPAKLAIAALFWCLFSLHRDPPAMSFTDDLLRHRERDAP
jgi:hypothetical protein